MRKHLLWAATAAAALLSVSAHADLSISNQPTQNMSCDVGVCSATAAKAVLNVTELADMLASGDVKLVSGNLAMDISVDTALSWTSTSRLTLDAFRSLTVNRPVTVVGTGAMTIITNDGGSDGDYRFAGKGHIEFWDPSSNLIINDQWYVLVKGLRKIERELRRRRFVALSRNYNAAKDGTYAHPPVPLSGGTFEGLGNVISNFSIEDSEDSQVGFFAEIGPGDFIRDVGLPNVSVQGAHSGQAVGALLGGNAGGSVVGCYATGKVAGSDVSNVGGLVGAVIGKTTDSHSAVAVSGGTSGTSGGLVGLNQGPIAQSYATGSVSAGDGSTVGGLIGKNDGVSGSPITTNSYATGTVTGGNYSLVGGLQGSITGSNAQLQTSYSTGAVGGGTGATIGGLIGSDTSQHNANTYWDLDTSGISNPTQGAGNIANDPGVTGLTDAQLKGALPAGFDPKNWGSNPKINNGYPYLLANPPQ